MTAPTDEALINDIKLSLAAGFNGARLHEKVFEERFLYHADRLGYLCWAEFADWSLTHGHIRRHHLGATPTFITQWLEVLQRDYSHPCIIGWCGMNETREPVTDRITDLDDAVRGMFLAAKAMDTTRPVIDVSGYSHRMQETDIFDAHDYTHDPEEFRQNIEKGLAGNFSINDNLTSPTPTQSIPYRNQPFFISEFGGIWWNTDVAHSEHSWGYGESPQSLDEFYDRFQKQCAVQLQNPNLFGYCYTQLYDVFQEHNGIYTFDRKPKFDLEKIRRAQTKPTEGK
jgi:beta-galactosidase/beta-glucuronidase